MRNQIAAAKRMGVRAATINSDNVDDWASVIASIARGEVDILLISPERLANEDFNSNVLAKISATVSMLVIDEAHCISDWGHDFQAALSPVGAHRQGFATQFEIAGHNGNGKQPGDGRLEAGAGPIAICFSGRPEPAFA
jgi:superfamily II DNA helicase RecQ